MVSRSPLECSMAGWLAGGRQAMALLDGGDLLVWPNLEAVCRKPDSPLVRTELRLGSFIPMQTVKQLGWLSIRPAEPGPAAGRSTLRCSPRAGWCTPGAGRSTGRSGTGRR